MFIVLRKVRLLKMADLDNLIDSKISLISHQDVRYDGTLFSINTSESSIVLKDGQHFKPKLFM